jgi:5-formyltetrahydrofolate cyclo-ligase
MNEIVTQKKKLRKVLVEKRNTIKQNSTEEFNIEVFNQLIESVDFGKIKYVASFISIRSEISTNQLNEKILEMKKTLSFPLIEKNSQELIFKKFNSNKNFELGKFNIPEPSKENKEIFPQLFFVPCLGFDLNGYRIGYGGGFYDKTFAKLKRLNYKFYAVGFAFDKQKQNQIPKENYDYKLDFVLTEKQLYTFL